MLLLTQFITHKSLKESYQTIPRAEILFKHDNGRNRDFLCIFELSAENTTTTICAVASIKEVSVISLKVNNSSEKVGVVCIIITIYKHWGV